MKIGANKEKLTAMVLELQKTEGAAGYCDTQMSVRRLEQELLDLASGAVDGVERTEKREVGDGLAGAVDCPVVF
ncbi:hypothetical protein B484DRAFT_407640, partial [Ochromonadaceae sp. CCMP2298]